MEYYNWFKPQDLVCIPTLPAELVHFMVHYIFDARAVGHSRVLLKCFEGFTGAVGFGLELAVLAVGRGAGVAALRVPPCRQRAVRSAFLHFHHERFSILRIKGDGAGLAPTILKQETIWGLRWCVDSLDML